MKEAIISPAAVRVSRSRNAVFRHFDLGDSAKGEKQLDQVRRRILGSLAHDVANSGGHGGVKENASGLQSGKIHAHGLSRLKGSHKSPRTKLCARFPTIANYTALSLKGARDKMQRRGHFFCSRRDGEAHVAGEIASHVHINFCSRGNGCALRLLARAESSDSGAGIVFGRSHAKPYPYSFLG